MDEQEMVTLKETAEAMGLSSDLNPPTNKTNVRPMKPSGESVNAIVDRLLTLSTRRRAKTDKPELYEAFASSLSRFPMSVIDCVCTKIEEAPRRQGELSFPDLGTLVEMCRREASRTAPVEGHQHWPLAEYRDCVWFDKFLREQTEPDPDHPQRKPKTRSEVFAAHPSMARLWTRWHNLMELHLIDCPEWCSECEGEHVVIRYEDGSKPWSLGDYGMTAEGAKNRTLENEKRKTLSMMTIPCPKCRPASERKPPQGIAGSTRTRVTA